MAFSVVVEGIYFLSILMEWGERDVLFHKTIFIFGPCGAKNKNLSQLTLAPGLMGPKKFFASKKFFKLADARSTFDASIESCGR